MRECIAWAFKYIIKVSSSNSIINVNGLLCKKSKDPEMKWVGKKTRAKSNSRNLKRCIYLFRQKKNDVSVGALVNDSFFVFFD